MAYLCQYAKADRLWNFKCCHFDLEMFRIAVATFEVIRGNFKIALSDIQPMILQ